LTDLFFPELRRNPGERGAACGVLTCWLAADGSWVRVGQRLAEVRMVGPCPDELAWWVSALATGTLWHQARAGDVLTAGSIVGLIE
jgi:hypothetical protein